MTDDIEDIEAPKITNRDRLFQQQAARMRALEAVVLRGGHAHTCGEIHRPHMHRGIDCDEAHPCDCGWAEMLADLRRRATEALRPEPVEGLKEAKP